MHYPVLVWRSVIILHPLMEGFSALGTRVKHIATNGVTETPEIPRQMFKWGCIFPNGQCAQCSSKNVMVIFAPPPHAWGPHLWTPPSRVTPLKATFLIFGLMFKHVKINLHDTSRTRLSFWRMKTTVDATIEM